MQVHIEWTGNNTTAIETVDVITNSFGNFTVGQFLFPEDLVVGDNETYRVYAEVTEMFAFNGNRSQPIRGRRSKHDGGLLCMDILQKRRTTVLARLQGLTMTQIGLEDYMITELSIHQLALK